MNELIFLIQTIIIGSATLIALRLGACALVAFICTQCVLANIFVTKQIMLFGLSATCADAFTIGATLGLNLLQEYYGKTITRSTIWINFFILIFYAIVSQIHLWYLPSAADTMQPHFVPLLSVMPRIVIASFSVYLIAQTVDYYVYGLLKRTFTDRFLIVRNYGSMLASQLVDTVLFTIFGLSGLVDNIWHVMFISYIVKVLAIAGTAPFVALSRWIIPKNPTP